MDIWCYRNIYIYVNISIKCIIKNNMQQAYGFNLQQSVTVITQLTLIHKYIYI